MQETTNYKLKKPDYTDYADIAILNGNMEIIDEELKNRATLVDGKVPAEQLPETQGLKLGETSDTAYRGDRGKEAYDHSQKTTGNPHNTKAEDIIYEEDVTVKAALDSMGGAFDKFVAMTTTFNADGSITEVSGTQKKVTTFDSDTQITEKLFDNEVLQATKVTTFNGDTISEVVS